MLWQNKGTNPQNRNGEGGKDDREEDVNSGSVGYDKGKWDVVGDGYDVGKDNCEGDEYGDDVSQCFFMKSLVYMPDDFGLGHVEHYVAINNEKWSFSDTQLSQLVYLIFWPTL